MSRPLLEMADIVRYAGQGFIERSRRWINGQHEKVLTAIMRCRTAALGGHRDRCTGCGHTTAISYNSCRNRHCHAARANAPDAGSSAPSGNYCHRYVHAVFTLPRELAPLALQNKRLSTPCSFTPVLRPCLKSPAIHATSCEIGFYFQRAPQLESAPAVSSSHPLRDCCRRPRSGSLRAGSPPAFLLPAHRPY